MFVCLIFFVPIFVFSSVLRNRNNSFDGTHVTDNSAEHNFATILINYNTLCDDIYICDWI